MKSKRVFNFSHIAGKTHVKHVDAYMYASLRERGHVHADVHAVVCVHAYLQVQVNIQLHMQVCVHVVVHVYLHV